MQDGQFHTDDPGKKKKPPTPQEVLGKSIPTPEDVLGVKKKEASGSWWNKQLSTTGLSGGSGLTKTGKTVDGIETVTIDEEPVENQKKYYRGTYLSFPKIGSADIAGGAGSVAKDAAAAASDATIKKLTSPEAISAYVKEFETRTGAGSFNLGSDLPQIKEARDERKFVKYRDIDKRLDSIGTGEGDLKDFDTIKKETPRLFENVKKELGIEPDATQSEDNQVWDVFTKYKSKVFDDRLEIGRERRKTLTSEIETTLPAASVFTGKEYKVPQSVDEVKQIFSDLDQKKAALAMTIESGGGSVQNKLAQIMEAEKQIAEAEKARPALIRMVSGMVFEEQSKLNPNLEPFELGKKIYEVIDPKGYALYKAAGGDELYGNWGSGFDDTPKKADAINRYIANLGIDAFNTFGNKSAIEKADLEAKSLGWKYTRPLQEETRHMIAAELHRQGIKPHKASEAEKDAIAETLPEINRNIWFDQNKSENNTSLPSTGFGKSLSGSYHHTIEDATKGLLGWMMPNRGRERALDVLEQQTVSDVVGENPESRARLSALRETENKRTLTEEEKSEKDYLEKFNDVRTGWQKFKDLSGSGVGQFAGFGTIAAFTGGLGNVRTPIQGIKALISPMAGRKGMLAAGYLMSREQNARDAVQMFPGEDEGIARFVYGETATTIDTFVERLFPEEKFLSGIFKKEAKSLIPSLTAKNLRKELNENLASKISKSIFSKVAKQQVTPLQESAEEMLAAKIKDTFHGILDPSAEAMTLNDIVNVGTQAYLSSQLLGVPKGLMATRNQTVPLNAIWDAASDKKTFFDVKSTILELEQKGELTPEEAGERISLLDKAQKLYQENPVLSGNMGALPLSKRQNYMGRLLNESVLQKRADETTDDNVRRVLNEEIAQSKDIRRKIFDGELNVTDRNEEQVPKPDLGFDAETGKATSEGQSKTINGFTPQENEAIQTLSKKNLENTSFEMQWKVLRDEGTSPEQKKAALKEISDQLTAPASEAAAGLVLGKDADLIYDLKYEAPQESAALQELTQPEQKEWNELSMEEKRKLAIKNLPQEETQTKEEKEIIELANTNAKYLLAKLHGEELSRPIELDPRLPEDKKAQEVISGNTWYRGVNKNNEGKGDKFYSADESTAHDYAINKVGDNPTMTKMEETERPKKPLVVGTKEDLAETIGFPEENIYDLNGDFDAKAKEYAASKGHDAIIYESGSMDQPEMHVFEKPGKSIKSHSAETEQQKTKLAEQRDAAIKAATKISVPDQLEWVDAALFGKMKDPSLGYELNEQQKKLKKDYSLLKKLINC